jgi:hypothetical protein
MTIAVLDINLDPIEYITFYGVSFIKFDDMDFKIAESDGTAVEVKAHISYLYYKRTGSDTVFAGV